MATTTSSACKVMHNIPPASQERFLMAFAGAKGALSHHHIMDAGISMLKRPYEIGRQSFFLHHVVIMTTQGEGILEVAGRRTPLRPGDVAMLPVGCDHCYRAGRSWHILWFHLKPESAWDHLVGDTCNVVAARRLEDLQLYTEQFWQESLAGRPWQVEALEALAKMIATTLKRHGRPATEGVSHERHRRLEQLWQAIAENPGERWDGAALCRVSGFSRTRLYELCKAVHGTSVTEQLIRLRMERAAYYLTNTDKTLAEIASLVGYESPFAFSRAFKRHTGNNPQNHRQK